MSGRPGSNRPPRPWQGRALPNELLPLVKRSKSLNLNLFPLKELRGAKIGIETILAKKFYLGLVYLGVYSVLS